MRILIVAMILGGAFFVMKFVFKGEDEIVEPESSLVDKPTESESLDGVSPPPDSSVIDSPGSSVVDAESRKNDLEMALKEWEQKHDELTKPKKTEQIVIPNIDKKAYYEILVYRFENRSIPSEESLRAVLGDGVTVDIHSNSVFVAVEEPDRIAKLSGALSALDVPSSVPIYRVEAFLVDATLNKSDDFSLTWLWQAGLKDVSPSPLFSGTQPGIFQGSPGLVTFDGHSFSAAVERVRSRGILEILSRPNMLLSPGESAIISSGREIPIPVSNAQDGNVITSVDYRPVLLELSVSIREVSRGNILLDIEQVNSLVGSTVTIGESDVPELVTQQWKTTVNPEIGHWYALGGVRSNEKQNIKRKGFFFLNSKVKTNNRREFGMFVRVTPGGVSPGSPSMPVLRAEPIVRAIPINSK